MSISHRMPAMHLKYIRICIVVYVFCAAIPALPHEEVLASNSDVLASIDSFLSEGIEHEATASVEVATGSSDVPASGKADGESARETAQSGDAANPEGWMPLPVLPPRVSAVDNGRTIRPIGEGVLDVVVTTVREKTPRQVSIMPERIELWAQDRLLAALENGEPGVENAFHRRTFSFPPLALPAGYYFVTIRGFAEGFVTRERKWKGKTVQVGIHDGKTTKLHEALSMFVW